MTLYDNKVVEAKFSDLMETKLNTRSLMTVDDSLSAEAGVVKTINVYTYTGAVEDVERGEGNTTIGEVSYVGTDYTVGVAQQTFRYYDEDFMKDPNVVDASMNGAADLMANDINSKYFAELAKATLTHACEGAFSYDNVVDAIAKMNIEDESGLFLIIGNDLKATVRKDPDFKAANLGEIIFKGQIGYISGVPVIVSAKCPVKTAYLATKEAITLFIKKDSEVEQDRDIETRKNTVVLRKVNLVALTDATKLVKITAA